MKFNFVKIPELDFELNTETIESKRFYVTPTGEKYPSVTTVLSSYNKKSILEWRKKVGDAEANRIAGQASSRGTKIHTLCENYIKGEFDDLQNLMPFHKMLFLQLKPFLDEKVNNIYCLEQPLFSHKLRLAGRVDLIADWDNQISVIDFKTSTKMKNESKIENYFMQCCAYAIMFEELTGKKVENIVVAIATEEQLPQVFIKKKYNYIDMLNTYIDDYWGNSDK